MGICEADRANGYQYKFTRGHDALAPGCGDCWCCRREVAPGAALKAEETKLLKELNTHEQQCLKTNTNFKAQDPQTKFPCLDYESTKFFAALKTEGKACLNYSGGEACFVQPKMTGEKDPGAQEQALLKASHDETQETEGTKSKAEENVGLKVKKGRYTNPFSLPK